MQLMLAVFVLSLAAYVSAVAEVNSVIGYHERIGIPAASKIKAAEDAYLSNENPSSRIAGGTVPRANAHPYMGGLIVSFKNQPTTGVCGSSLVSRNRLVTAAHCWFDGRFQANRFVVVLGSDFLFHGGERIATSTIATHPAWNPATLLNDVAVIYLQNNVFFTTNIQAIALPTDRSESFAGLWAVAVGYGRTSDEQVGVSLWSVMSEVNLQVITVEQCQSVFGSFAQPNHICTSGEGGVGICGGDTGGPLLVQRDGRRILIGVSSFVASAGCQAGFPSGFSRVTSFYDFIRMHL